MSIFAGSQSWAIRRQRQWRRRSSTGSSASASATIDMATKKQNRRSVSIRGETYRRLREYCQRHGVSVSGTVEALVIAKLDNAEGFPDMEDVAKTAQPWRDTNTRPKKPETTEEEIEKFFPGGIHSF